MLKAIKRRRSIRNFQPQEIEEEKLQQILQAAQFAPSANHRRPWQFWLVRDKTKLSKVAAQTNWGSFISQAPAAIVLALDSETSSHWKEDGAIVGAHIYLEATNQGLGTCWVHVADKSSEQPIKELLDIPNKLRVLAVFPIGYPAEEKAPHQISEYDEDKVHEYGGE